MSYGNVLAPPQPKPLLLLTCGRYDNVVRWIPLIVTNAQIDGVLAIFAAVLGKA